MFNRMYLYKHVNNTDIAFRPIKTFFVTEKQLFKVKICWYNIGKCHKPWSMDIIETIEIKKEDKLNWKLYYDLMLDKEVNFGD